MRRLILFRHGKSDWNAPHGSDHERPLSRRGIGAAETMGRVLARSGHAPDHAITSSAVRARSTLELAGTAGDWSCSVEVTDRLYGTTAHGALEVASGVTSDVSTLMLVGHEPTWSDLAHRLTGGRVTVKTATAIGIDLWVDSWVDVDSSGSLSFVLQPRDFSDWVGAEC
jgi:phosphohistidine phosphatase